MTTDQSSHDRRFRSALIGYVILAVFAVAALGIGYVQEREINRNEQRINTSAKRLSILLATSGYQICVQTKALAATVGKVGHLDCNAVRTSADEIYHLLTK